MRVDKKKLFSTGLVVASIAAVIYIAFSNSELENAWEALEHLTPLWLLGAFGCWFAYLFFDVLSCWIYLRKEGFRISLGRTLNATLIGFYYGNITPTSAGGQPMQVNSLRKAGVPVGYGTMAATVRLLCNQFAVVTLSLVFWIANREFVQRQLGDALWLARIGWIINFMLVPLGLMAVYQRSLIQRIALWLIHLGGKLHIVRHQDTAIAVTTDVLDTYHTALMGLTRAPSRLLTQLLCSFLSFGGLFSTVYFVYHAFGFTGTPWYHLFSISSLLYVSASYTPLPGASGAQEGGFLLYYQGIIPGDRIGLALLVWRFFTYYLFLIIGMFTVLLDKYLIARDERRKKFKT